MHLLGKRGRMKWKEFESNQCCVVQEERHLASSEGKSGVTQRGFGNLEKIAVSYYRLHLALLGDSSYYHVF